MALPTSKLYSLVFKMVLRVIYIQTKSLDHENLRAHEIYAKTMAWEKGIVF